MKGCSSGGVSMGDGSKGHTLTGRRENRIVTA